MIRIAVLTVSDSGFARTRRDESGPELARACAAAGWTVVERDLVPDEVDRIRDRLERWIQSGTVDCIFTTGGTGVAPRDITPEATRLVLQREIPGLSELTRMRGLEQTPTAVLSRGLTGSAGQVFIANLPGSPKGAVFSFEILRPLIPHVIRLLAGDTEHPGSKGN